MPTTIWSCTISVRAPREGCRTAHPVGADTGEHVPPGVSLEDDRGGEADLLLPAGDGIAEAADQGQRVAPAPWKDGSAQVVAVPDGEAEELREAVSASPTRRSEGC